MTPTRRWLIRTCCLLPLLLCLSAWAWSVTHCFWTEWYCNNGYYFGGDTARGAVTLCWGFYPELTPPSWSAGTIPTSPSLLDNHACLGFALYRTTNLDNRQAMYELDRKTAQYLGLPPVAPDYLPEKWKWFVTIPYWFLLLLFSLLALYVFRKTRPKISPATAFPVEITGGPS